MFEIYRPYASGKPPVCMGKTLQQRPIRQRTCLNGKLVYSVGKLTHNDAFTLDCCISNVSDGGAMITLTSRVPLPALVYLIDIKHCVAHEAEVRWLYHPSRGLKFLQTHHLHEKIPDALDFLRKLWGDLYIRSGDTRQ